MIGTGKTRGTQHGSTSHNQPDALHGSTEDRMTYIPANTDLHAATPWAQNEQILAWLSRFTNPGVSLKTLTQGVDPDAHKRSVESAKGAAFSDDWQMVASLCGYTAKDFMQAEANLPITAAEADYFRRNHRSTENHISRDFLIGRVDLPSPLAEFYGLYLYRARLDAEATLFVAQATGSTRVARIMADLLAIGGFAGGLEFISHMGLTYSVPAAFDTSAIIDCANLEAARRTALATDHPSHLLRLTPDEIGILATRIADSNVLSPSDFLDKANLLAEARQDVTRLPVQQHFATAIAENDLPPQHGWVTRLCEAYTRMLGTWAMPLAASQAATH